MQKNAYFHALLQLSVYKSMSVEFDGDKVLLGAF